MPDFLQIKPLIILLFISIFFCVCNFFVIVILMGKFYLIVILIVEVSNLICYFYTYIHIYSRYKAFSYFSRQQAKFSERWCNLKKQSSLCINFKATRGTSSLEVLYNKHAGCLVMLQTRKF